LFKNSLNIIYKSQDLYFKFDFKRYFLEVPFIVASKIIAVNNFDGLFVVTKPQILNIV